MTEQSISIERLEDAASLFGALDENIRMLEREFDVTITNRDGLLKISGEERQVPAAVQAVNGLLTLCARGEEMNEQLIRYVFSLVRAGRPEEIESFGRDVLCITSRGKPIRAKTSGQMRYIKAIQN
ncbi:MAG: phosphate starvation-inducible protein PhoH, partial [Oscillospiraceae bacterium]|nr:phosphate starvation-inducible protein PhoH [Oscillospiraceae bacterium]